MERTVTMRLVIAQLPRSLPGSITKPIAPGALNTVIRKMPLDAVSSGC